MKTLIVLIGPTGVGKTELSLEMAEFFHCPIINADSRQIYHQIPIGTAAPTAEDQHRIKHYFVGTLDLQEYYSAALYEEEALKVIEELFKQHDVLILSGGSMLYIDAVCRGIDQMPTIDEVTRQMMARRYKEEGLEPLQRELRLLDPEYYNKVDICNPKRVVHALEICYMTGCTYTSFRQQGYAPRPFNILKIGLRRERAELYERINSRVDVMVRKGLLDEARRVYPLRELNALNTVGYKELFRFFDGEWALPFALDKIRQNSRIYSKKQMTWFLHDETTHWFHPKEKAAIWQLLSDLD